MNPFYSTTNPDRQQQQQQQNKKQTARKATNALAKVQEHMHGLFVRYREREREGGYTGAPDLFAPQLASNYFRTCHSSGSQRIILKHLMAEGIFDSMGQWNGDGDGVSALDARRHKRHIRR